MLEVLGQNISYAIRTLFKNWRASRVEPLEALRYE